MAETEFAVVVVYTTTCAGSVNCGGVVKVVICREELLCLDSIYVLVALNQRIFQEDICMSHASWLLYDPA
jgi:hypothetical protein